MFVCLINIKVVFNCVYLKVIKIVFCKNSGNNIHNELAKETKSSLNAEKLF